MSDSDENMVLRTLYIPSDLDQKLRELAFSNNTTKSELIRRAIAESLAGLKGPTLAMKIDARVEAGSARGTAAGRSNAAAVGAGMRKPKRMTRNQALSVESA